ncbi:conserved hypothetical protein [Anaeromyxobacter sp. K]|uniref:hypothetical protein n=1 Tax=Anaeromyxobacter sp. (strain K) TaxID=447217 RepID=UPI00017BE237|nr:hypothetical protein [Anaeromyxobacter sp. K]ACG73196.1 conserved hypothetical protein [Anaeromyxobacter sp. K]
MILLEFAAQGVRGVAPAGGRATLRPGYNVVSADGAALRRLLEALLHPDPRDGEALPRAPGGPAGAAVRAGLTLVGDDRVTYRLVRDFTAGAQLHRFDAERRAFSLVSQDLAEIAAALRAPIGVPPRARQGALLTIAAADLPSRRPSVAGAAAAVPQRAPLSPEQARRRREQLEGERVRARASEKLQQELDGLQARATELEVALRDGARLREALAAAGRARDELAPAAAARDALGDADAALAAYEKAAARRADAVARVQAERAGIEEAEASGAPLPFWRAPPFWAGAGAGALLAAAGVAGAAAATGMRYLALLDIPAFGWAAWVALRWVSAQEGWERIARRRRVVDDWQAKVEAQFERDGAAVRGALAALGLARPTELREVLGKLAEAEAAVTGARARLEAWEAKPEARGAAAEKARLDEQQAALEARLASEAGGFVRDVRSIEAELQRLEAEATAPAPPAPAPVVAAPAAAEPLRELLQRAAAELGGSAAAAGRGVAEKAGQVLAGLTSQRLGGVQVDDRGGLHVLVAGRPAAAISLPPADRDLVFLAMKLAFLEQGLAGGRRVGLVDDAFQGLSDGARRFAARLLKQAARAGQVVHATADLAFREAADHGA